MNLEIKLYPPAAGTNLRKVIHKNIKDWDCINEGELLYVSVNNEKFYYPMHAIFSVREFSNLQAVDSKSI
jgi:hypothetical protein